MIEHRRRPNFYRLDGHVALPVVNDNFEAHVRAMADLGEQGRRVGFTEIGVVTISTIFLGVDHQFKDEGPPLLFETMLFADDRDVIAGWRCSTWDEAERLHAEGIDYAKRLNAEATALLDEKISR